MHLDIYRNHYAILIPGNKRPDLFGLDANGDWLIAESKGRTGRFDTRAFDDAHKQVKKAVRIRGENPTNKIASQIFFSNEGLNLRLEDPPEEKEIFLDIDVSKEEFLRRYYAPLIELINNNDSMNVTIDDQEYVLVNVREWDVEIGLSTKVIKAVNEKIIELFLSIPKKDKVKDMNQANIKIGNDGIVVRVDEQFWNSDLTSKELESRYKDIMR